MKELVNKLSWSFSRRNLFYRCQRKYWIRYYLSWNGWKNTAPPTSRKAYFLKKLTGRPLYEGDQVHKALAQLVNALPNSEEMYENLVPTLADIKGTVERSKEIVSEVRTTGLEVFTRTSKHPGVPIFGEHWYDQKLDPPEKMHQRISNAIQLGLAYILEVYKEDPTTLSVEELDELEIGGYPCYASIDWAYKTGKRKKFQVVILDWKTGRKYDTHSAQLGAYALWALEKGLDLRRTTFRDVYLSQPKDGLPTVETLPTFTASNLKQLTKEVQADMEVLSAKLVDKKNNVPKPASHFEMAGSKSTDSPCKWCEYRDICFPGRQGTCDE